MESLQTNASKEGLTFSSVHFHHSIVKAISPHFLFQDLLLLVGRAAISLDPMMLGNQIALWPPAHGHMRVGRMSSAAVVADVVRRSVLMLMMVYCWRRDRNEARSPF